MAHCPNTSPSPGLIVGIGTGVVIEAVIEAVIRGTAGISGISETREISMVIPGIAETERTAGLTIVGIDESMTAGLTSERTAARSHHPSVHEKCRRLSRKRSLLVSSQDRRYQRNS
jgi:hypothetical protein